MTARPEDVLVTCGAQGAFDLIARVLLEAGVHAPWPTQACLASLIDDGLLARHVGRMRREYAARHERILNALRGELSDWLAPQPCAAGIHVAAVLLRGGTRLEAELERRARQCGIGLDRLSPYYAAGPARAGFVLGYGAIQPAKIDAGLHRLRQCLAAAARP